jgi:hypothetical protein
MRKAIACAVVVCLAGCPPNTGKVKTAPTPPPGMVGAACQPGGEGLTQGTCAAGLFCLGMAPGGYCTSFCPCGAGAACAESLRAPELCAKSCASDADCRSGAGYVCDATWKVCTLPQMLAPKAPMCDPPAPAPPRKSFGKVVQLSTAASGSPNFEPTAAIDRDGDLVVAYIAGLAVGKPNHIAISKLNVARDLVDSDHVFRLDRENHFDPWLASDRKGRLYLVWLGFDGGGVPEKRMQVGLSTSDDGLTWTKPVVANDINTDCPREAPGCLDKPMVAVGPDRKDPRIDDVYVFYYSEPSKGLRAVHSNDGAESFSPSAPVGDGAYADADVTKSGRIHVVFEAGGQTANQLGDTKNGIYYTNSEDGANSFNKPARVSGEGEQIPFYFSNPQLIADVNAGVLYVVYPSGSPDGKWDILLASSSDGGKTWARATVNDDGPCASHMVPTATLDPATGRVHIIWFENRSGTGALAYASCIENKNKNGVVCSPNETVSDIPFAAYGFARHSPKWLGEYNSLVLDPRHKLLHAVWTQPVDEGGKPVSRIFTSAARLK